MSDLSTATTIEALLSILLIKQTIFELLFLIKFSALGFNSLTTKSSYILYSNTIPFSVSLVELLS